MKNLIKPFLFVALATVILAANGCKKETTSAVLDQVLGTMKATISGQPWAASAPAAIVSNGVVALTGQPGITSIEKTILITVKGTELKAYTLNANVLVKPASADCFIAYKLTADADSTLNPDSYYVSYDANVTITKYDATNKRISGTFTAAMRPANALTDALKEIKIENGSFANVNFITSK